MRRQKRKPPSRGVMKAIIAIFLVVLFVSVMVIFSMHSKASAESNKTTVEIYMERVEPYKETIFRILDAENVPRDFIFLCLAESGGDPSNLSKAGAAGLWQLMPHTANVYGITAKERYDVEKSTRAAARYIRHLLDVFDNDPQWAIAAYNAGGHNLKRVTGYKKGMDFAIVKDKRPAAYALAKTVKGMANSYPSFKNNPSN